MRNSLNNSAQLIGNVVNDPITKTLDSGRVASTFRLATNNTYKDKQGNKIENVTFHRVVAWGKTAEIVNQFIKKGKHIAIKGEISNRTYLKKFKGLKEPITMYTTDIILDEMQFLDYKSVTVAPNE
jgi:single-strand DNA-binding protein